MKNKLRQALTGRVFHMMSGGSQDSRFCSSDTWRYECYLAKTCELEGHCYCLEASFWPFSSKNQSCLHTGFPGRLQNLPVLCTVLNGPSLLMWDPFSFLHSAARIMIGWTGASQFSRKELQPEQSPGGALVFVTNTPSFLTFRESFQSITTVWERAGSISGPKRSLIHLQHPFKFNVAKHSSALIAFKDSSKYWV